MDGKTAQGLTWGSAAPPAVHHCFLQEQRHSMELQPNVETQTGRKLRSVCRGCCAALVSPGFCKTSRRASVICCGQEGRGGTEFEAYI